MITFTHVIAGAQGLHARPVAEIARRALDCQSLVTISVRDRSTDAKDMVGLMGLDARCGEAVEVTVAGADEESAAATMQAVCKEFL